MEASEERRVKVEDTVFQASGFYMVMILYCKIVDLG